MENKFPVTKMSAVPAIGIENKFPAIKIAKPTFVLSISLENKFSPTKITKRGFYARLPSPAGIESHAGGTLRIS